jgi:hypothetical protein
MVKSLTNSSVFFAVIIPLSALFTIIAGADVANADATVTYVTVPTGKPVPVPIPGFTLTGAGCIDAPGLTADATVPGPDSTTFQFAFWNLNGKLNFNPTVAFCWGATNTFATAWYVQEGLGGPCIPTSTSTTCVQTFAYSLRHNEFLANGTAIESVVPDGTAWTSPSTTVLTNVNEAITAKAEINFPQGPEPFFYWTQLSPSLNPPSSQFNPIFEAKQGSTVWELAAYGPNPCQALIDEAKACFIELGEIKGGGTFCRELGMNALKCQDGELPR